MSARPQHERTHCTQGAGCLGTNAEWMNGWMTPEGREGERETPSSWRMNEWMDATREEGERERGHHHGSVLRESERRTVRRSTYSVRMFICSWQCPKIVHCLRTRTEGGGGRESGKASFYNKKKLVNKPPRFDDVKKARLGSGGRERGRVKGKRVCLLQYAHLKTSQSMQWSILDSACKHIRI